MVCSYCRSWVGIVFSWCYRYKLSLEQNLLVNNALEHPIYLCRMNFYFNKSYYTSQNKNPSLWCCDIAISHYRGYLAANAWTPFWRCCFSRRRKGSYRSIRRYDFIHYDSNFLCTRRVVSNSILYHAKIEGVLMLVYNTRWFVCRSMA